MPHFPKPFFKKARNCWYVEIDRRQHKLGSDREEAFRRYHELMGKPRDRQVASQSLAAIADLFLEWVQRHRAADTYEWYRYRLERFIRTYPELRTSDIRPYHVETWVDGYELSKTSRRNYLRSVKRCMAWAKRQGYIDTNPIENLEIPSGERREVVITPEQFDAMRAMVRNPDLIDLMIVTRESGCRPQESLHVEARHVDVAHQRWVFSDQEAKMKRTARIVYLTDRAMEITRRRMDVYSSGPIFRNTSGKPWTTEAVNCAFSVLQARMGKIEMKKQGLEVSESEIAELIPQLKQTRRSKGEEIPKTPAELRCEAKRKLTIKLAATLVPRCSLYALRHSWATFALQKGIDPLTVAILMGHQDPSMLSRVYQHLSLNPAHMLDQARRAAG